MLQWLQVISDGCDDRDFLNYPFRVIHSRSLSSQSPPLVKIRIQGVLEIGAIINGVYVAYVSTVLPFLMTLMSHV